MEFLFRRVSCGDGTVEQHEVGAWSHRRRRKAQRRCKKRRRRAGRSSCRCQRRRCGERQTSSHTPNVWSYSQALASPQKVRHMHSIRLIHLQIHFFPSSFLINVVCWAMQAALLRFVIQRWGCGPPRSASLGSVRSLTAVPSTARYSHMHTPPRPRHADRVALDARPRLAHVPLPVP